MEKRSPFNGALYLDHRGRSSVAIPVFRGVRLDLVFRLQQRLNALLHFGIDQVLHRFMPAVRQFRQAVQLPERYRNLAELHAVGNVEPRFFRLVKLCLVEAETLENAGGHHHVAAGVHVNAVNGQVVAFVCGRRFEGGLHLFIQVADGKLLFLGQFAEEFVIAGEFGVVVVGNLLNHRGGQDHDLDMGGFALLDDFGDVLLVLVERNSIDAVPDVVDAAGEGHPVGLFGNHVAIEAGEHVVGLVPADPGGDRGGVDAVGFEATDDQVDVAAGNLVAGGGDRVAEEGDFFPALDGDFGAGKRWE